jgi:hypothetical protein
VSAIVSPCGQFRYVLERAPLQPGLDAPTREPHLTCLFVMLNPSTADAVTDDPTIRRCITFAEREGYHRLTVVNLDPRRATDPTELAKFRPPTGLDLERNADFVRSAARSAGVVVVAWGAHPAARAELVERVVSVLRSKPLYCLGTTKDGHPRHPLFVRRVQALEPWEAAGPRSP